MNYRYKTHASRQIEKTGVQRKATVSRGVFDFWRGVGQNLNDNVDFVVRPKRRHSAVIAASVLGLSILFSLNSSVVMTQAVMHTDSRVLASAMEINPGAVAFLLNKIDVSE